MWAVRAWEVWAALMTKVVLGSKQSGETKKYIFDFTSNLSVGETISSASAVAAVYSGTDSSPSSVISGSASTSGAQVTQTLTAGTEGVIYTITCTALTSASQTIKQTGFLAVVPNSA